LRQVAANLAVSSSARLPLPTATERKIQRIYEIGTAFFADPVDQRMRSRLDFDCGYCAYGEEHSGDDSRPDRVESFKASLRTVELAEALESSRARELHRAMVAAFRSFERITEDILYHLMELVRRGGSEPEGTRGILSRWSQIQLNYSIPTPAGILLQTEHEDGHLLTIAHSAKPGLEVKQGATYFPVTREDGEAIAMLGELARLLSAGLLAPAYHRVRAPTCGGRRLSLLFFADVAPEACRPWAEGAVNSDVDIAAHVRRNSLRFGLAGFGDKRPDVDEHPEWKQPFHSTTRGITRDYD
jgi:isopenicillin N synthase-like dioxygenase